MKINNTILIARPKPKMRTRSKTPVVTNPTNDFGGTIRADQRKIIPEVGLFKSYSIEALKR